MTFAGFGSPTGLMRQHQPVFYLSIQINTGINSRTSSTSTSHAPITASTASATALPTTPFVVTFLHLHCLVFAKSDPVFVQALAAWQFIGQAGVVFA
jgi:hypothetical protein